MTDHSTLIHIAEQPEDFPHDDLIDSRDLIDRNFGTEINAQVADAEDYSDDWQYGATLIAKHYFREYAQELAEDIGAIPDGRSWPMTCIDWDMAARDLSHDYSLITIDGRDYYIL